MFDRTPRSSAIPPLTVEARKRIEDAIEQLMVELDADDALTEDLEPFGDDEPSLGSPEVVRHPEHPSRPPSRASIDRSCDQTHWGQGHDQDCELDTSDNEPSLGSGAVHELRTQEAWAQNGDTDEREDENEHASDDDDGEPDLGATTAMNQIHAWSPPREAMWFAPPDGEPSLGWTGNGRGHPDTAMRGYDEDREACQ